MGTRLTIKLKIAAYSAIKLNIGVYNRDSLYCSYRNSNSLAWREAPAAGRMPAGEGANLDRRLVPYTRDASESNLASCTEIYINK